jgi:hypothetical protein
VGDLNADGNLDMVGDDIILLGPAPWSAPPIYYGDGDWHQLGQVGVAIGDFTGEGIPDLVTAISSVDIHIGRGDGTVDEPIAYSTNANVHTGVAVADFDGDGKFDVVTSDGDTGTVSLLLGNGDGTLRSAGAFAVGSSPSGVAGGDFNGDGRPDVAATNGGSNNVAVLLNDGNWATKTFVGPGGAGSGGNWATPSNWSPSGVPAASDLVTITGKSINLAASATVGSLSLTGGASLSVAANGSRVLRTSTLSISSNATLDLNDNALIIDYTGATPMLSIQSALRDGYAGGAWNGSGISSSLASMPGTALGYGEAGSLYSTFPATFAGQTIDSTSIVCRYTVTGDANLDRAVDTTDFNLLAANFGQSGRTFSQGDFNYDGVVDTLDFNTLAANFGKTLAPSSAADKAAAPVAPMLGGFFSDWSIIDEVLVGSGSLAMKVVG